MFSPNKDKSLAYYFIIFSSPLLIFLVLPLWVSMGSSPNSTLYFTLYFMSFIPFAIPVIFLKKMNHIFYTLSGLIFLAFSFILFNMTVITLYFFPIFKLIESNFITSINNLHSVLWAFFKSRIYHYLPTYFATIAMSIFLGFTARSFKDFLKNKKSFISLTSFSLQVIVIACSSFLFFDFFYDLGSERSKNTKAHTSTRVKKISEHQKIYLQAKHSYLNGDLHGALTHLKKLHKREPYYKDSRKIEKICLRMTSQTKK